MNKLSKVFREFHRKLFVRIVKLKTYENWAEKNYNSKPKISFVIQSHNKAKRVCFLVDKLRDYPNGEIIVIDDGSELKHTRMLTRKLVRANEFLLRCNDLYEVITYDRAIYLAKGEFVVLLQDDDDFPNLLWVDNGLRHFKNHDKLVILGGRDGAKLLPYDTSADNKRGPFVMEGNIAYRLNSFKIEIYSNLNTKSDFQFVQYVDRAPMWIRRELFFKKLINIDINYAPFQWDDAELCLRSWLLGLSVAWYPANFRIGALGDGGMRIWNSKLHNRQDEVNIKYLYNNYGKNLDYINELVDNCNLSHSSKSFF